MEIPGYVIKRQIGQGGMAVAYLAEQRSLKRDVVLKVLDTSAQITELAIERFLNEGRLIASLNHPHIITIYDIGQAEDQIFISMEYIEGGDLKERLKQKIYSPAEALAVIEAIASGLAAAHDAGIIHRDVKPGNILFRKDDTPILSDFGIAKRLDGNSNLTMTGMFLGSPNYMAPEQSDTGPIDGRADLYALGIILFEMLTGQRAYVADSVIGVLLKHRQAPLPMLPVPLESLQELLNLLLAKDRNARFRDARSLIHFIHELRRKELIASVGLSNQATRQVDEDLYEKTVTITRLHPVSAKPLWRRVLLPGLLLTCGIGWAVLFSIERQIEATTVRQISVPIPVALEAIPPPPPAQSSATATELIQIGEALLWLGQRSLQESRLTTPTGDNAYYYFSRLLQLDPTHLRARQGMRDIAARHAALAEREIAEGNSELAQVYITLGMQIDPQNDALRALAKLVSAPESSFWSTVKGLFRF